MKYHHNNKGNVILYIIVTMIIMAALGTGVFYVTLTSSFSGLGVSAQNKARYLAEAGIRYALANLRTLPITTSPLPEYKLNTSTGDKFILEINVISIKSTGISNPGTPYQASHKIELDITPSQYQALTSAPFSFTGTGSGGMASLAPPAAGAAVSGVTVDTSNQQINLGFSPSTGSCLLNTAGCVWYQGWAASNGSNCTEGRCNFNKGIRAYFDFQYNIPWQAEGFTFAIISAHNIGTVAAPVYINNVTDCGGGSCGEYMAYAGPGLTGNGIQPPKIAIEFDPSIPLTDDRATDVCSCNSRADWTFGDKHSAFIFWGNNSILCSSPASNTYDDNRHGSGDGVNDPQNPTNVGSYIIVSYDTISGGRMAFRLEIDRVDDSTSVDYRKYKMRAWLKVYNVNGYQDSNGVRFDDTSTKYNKNNDDPPSFQQTIAMTQVWHDQFDRMTFGWTQGTGASCQVVVLRNFKIDFKNTNDF